MADHQYPPSHHQSQIHHHQQPPSPASSTDSRSNSSNDRNPFPRNSSSPVKPTIPPSHPTTQQQQNSNPDRQKAAGNTQGFNAPVGYHPPYDSSSSSSHYPRLSPPPEHQAVAYPTAPPGQNTSWDYHPPYNHLQQRHLSPVHHPNPPSWNPNQPSPPLQSPSAPQDDSNDQVDQLADDLTAVPQSTPGPPPVISPPESPPQGSITLTAPNLPYHPRIHYPISSPGSDQPSSRQYSFVSLPGNAMRKRPRRKFDEIERLYACNFPGCTKAYGTLNHLNAHVSMQRHGQKRTPGEFKDMRRARKQAQREQARAAARDHQEEADGEDNGSPVAGPSTSPASSSRATKRKIRRATEPALHRIPSLDDATGGPNMPEEYGGRMAQASRQQQQLEISRRVSMDDYALQQAAGMMDRRGSGGSDEDTQGDDLADQPGPSSAQRILGASVTMPSGPMGGSTEQPLGLHGAHTTSPPALVSSGGQLPPMSMDSQGQSMQFWQQHQPPPSSVAAQHQAPISPTTVVAPHVSHLPGPGPAVPPGMPLHASSSAHHPRQPSWPPSGAYGAGSSSQVGQQQSGGPPPLVPATSYSSHHSNPLPFPLQPSAQQTQSPPSHMQQQTHIQHAIGVPTPSPPRSAPQTQTQHFQAHSQQQYSASPPPAAAAAAAAANSMHRLHQSSMLLTPLNVGGGASHRQSYTQEPSGTQSNQPSAYGQTTIGGGGGAGSSSAQGLPSVFELESLSRDPAQEQQQQRGSIQQQQHAQQQSAPIVQQTQTTSWESYQQSSTYSAAGPSHRDSYAAAAAPPSLGRSVGYDPSREYYPPTSRPDMYGGQRNVVYGAAVPQSRPEAHPAAAYGHPQRSVSYSAPASSDPYMVPGPSQSQRTDAQQPPPSSYIPARSESYSAVSSRGDPGAGYASVPGGGRSGPYGAAQQRQAPEQQQYQTIPPPQSHIPHHPGLHPQHLPSSDPAHPDPRHDPYGRGHPGPSEGPY